MAQLKTGDTAPEFELKDQSGATIKLSDFRGRKLLVYFFPKADTSGCTKQACSIRDYHVDLSALGVAAVGISPDMPEQQLEFDRKHSLGFPLLSDPNHAVAQLYGAWGEKKMYGKTYMGIVRSSFLIDGAGKVIQSWYKVKPACTVPDAITALESTTDEQLELKRKLKKLFDEQGFAVLATAEGNQPYTSLVAFAASEDLRHMVITTARSTRKYANLRSNASVSVLVDDRTNSASDFGEAVSVTILGTAEEISGPEGEGLRQLYLQKHAELRDFVAKETTALLRVNVESVYVVKSFPEVRVSLLNY
jgi:thioredoxin-dependent peroxiredoxin